VGSQAGEQDRGGAIRLRIGGFHTQAGVGVRRCQRQHGDFAPGNVGPENASVICPFGELLDGLPESHDVGV
jgi:hypothetical protein